MTVNHQRRILNTTKDRTSYFNDKKLALFEDFINKVHNGGFNHTHEFKLMGFNANGEIIEVKYKGCYVIVDNSYLN